MKFLIALVLLAGCPGKKDKQAPTATPSGAAAVVPNPMYDGGMYDGGADDALTATPMTPPQDASPAPPPDGLTGDGGPL